MRPSPVRRAPRGLPQRQRARSGLIPPPLGINAADDIATLSPVDAVDLVNMLRGQSGLVSRLGYAEWCIGMTNPVRTVLAFAGSASSHDRLFACTSTDIYNVTGSSAAPTSAHTFATPSSESGFGIGTVYANSAGHFLLYADEQNGYLLYTESTDAWTVVAYGTGAGQLSGVNPKDVCFVTSWKNRVCFVEKATGNLWYLPVGQITGTAEVVRLGNRFPHGGTLVGVWSCTMDGGMGIDDLLVAISSSGDVLVYQGDDPGTAGAFNLIGSWFIGAVPAGRRIATDQGGELLLLSSLGIVPLSRLRSGTVGPDLYTTRKIQPLFNGYMASRRDLLGWSLCTSPEDNALVVNMPLVGATYEQFAMSLATQGWSKFSGVPSLSSAPWKGSLYFGTTDGRVCKVVGSLDNVKLSGAATYSEITCSGLSAFQNLGYVGQKQIQEVQPMFWSDGALPGLVVEARYDFDTTAITATVPAADSSGLATWDSAVWDTATWPLAQRTWLPIRGVAGMGVYAAVAWKLNSSARITLTGINARYTTGGIR